MILENPATVKLLSALVEMAPRGATRELLQQKTGLGRTTFYRVLKPLLGRGIVREEGVFFNMPLEHPYNFLFKRLHAAEKVTELPSPVQDRVLSAVDHAKAHLHGHILALWLVGSVAHRTMTEDSDLDFLAVLDEEIEYLPDPAYALHFVTMTEPEFRARWTEKNDFALTALRHGLLLEDRGFAQEFYLQPLPVQLKATEFHQDVEELAQEKERFLLLIRSRARLEAAQALSHYAISIARRMLRVYNVLPAGKPQLLKACELLFGLEFRSLLEQAVQVSRVDSRRSTGELVEDCHQLESVYQRFSSELAHFQKFANLATTSGVRHEQLVGQALQELFKTNIEPFPGTDGWLKVPRQSYLLEVKSLEGPLTAAPLHQLARHMAIAAEQGKPAKGLLVANPYRSIPLLERPQAISAALQGLASELDIKLYSAMEILRAVNRSILCSPVESLLDGLPGSTTHDFEPSSMTKKSKPSSKGRQTSKKVASKAAGTLESKDSSKAVKTTSAGTDKQTAAASDLSQRAQAVQATKKTSSKKKK